MKVDRLLLDVAIPEASSCDGGGSELRARGWVPAWNNDEGKLNEFVHSRGC